jgi:hypothetical protein
MTKDNPAKTPHPWSSDALFLKAQRYAEEMLSHERDEWLFAFWSTLTLELLSRAALAHVSPALLADSKDWTHLYFALGHPPKAPKFVPKSVDISAALSRLREINPSFELRLESFAALHLSRRNEELHSGSTPFDSIASNEWIPLFYEACAVLTKGMGETMESLFGKEEAVLAVQIVAAAKDEGAKAAAKNIHAHKTVWEEKNAEERGILSAQASLWAKKQTGHRVTCPSCNSDALVIGNAVAPATQRLKDGLIVETQDFLPEKFECTACGLKIVGLAHLHASGLGDTYKTTSTYDPAEYYAVNNDEYSGYEDDNNEPY